ncbi:MAG: Fe2+-dependent dioxygenase [Acidiferrobacteraceae bacterium]
MMLRLPKVLAPGQVEAARRLIRQGTFVDGKLSAGAVASRVKRNQEMDRRHGVIAQLDGLVMGALVHHPEYRAAAMARHVATPHYARYTPGMSYGLHLDDPIMSADGIPYRSDIAITVFLSGPDEYEGGELLIETDYGSHAMKPDAGDAVMYPASSLHRVGEVTAGERLVAVTWVQSMVRDPARRQLLYDLYRAREALLTRAPDAPETVRLGSAYINLVRMWSEL